MQQLLLWLGLLETLSGIPAIIQTLKGSERMPGDFGFDPLGCGKNPEALASGNLAPHPLFERLLDAERLYS